jgi:hypothetical protein
VGIFRSFLPNVPRAFATGSSAEDIPTSVAQFTTLGGSDYVHVPPQTQPNEFEEAPPAYDSLTGSPSGNRDSRNTTRPSSPIPDTDLALQRALYASYTQHHGGRPRSFSTSDEPLINTLIMPSMAREIRTPTGAAVQITSFISELLGLRGNQASWEELDEEQRRTLADIAEYDWMN